MTELFTEAFERYGLRVTVTRRGADQAIKTETRAFLQPTTAETADEPFAATPLGAAEKRVWRYLGPAEVEVAMGDHVKCGGQAYVARNAAAVYAGDEVAYYWAALTPEAAREDAPEVTE